MGNCCSTPAHPVDERESEISPPQQRLGAASASPTTLGNAVSEWHRRRLERRQRRSEMVEQEQQQPEVARQMALLDTHPPTDLEDPSATHSSRQQEISNHSLSEREVPGENVSDAGIPAQQDNSNNNNNYNAVRRFQEAVLAGFRLHHMQLANSNLPNIGSQLTVGDRPSVMFADPTFTTGGAVAAQGGERFRDEVEDNAIDGAVPLQQASLFNWNNVDGFLDMLIALHELQEQQQHQPQQGSDNSVGHSRLGQRWQRRQRRRNLLLAPHDGNDVVGDLLAAAHQQRPAQRLASLLFPSQRGQALPEVREAHMSFGSFRGVLRPISPVAEVNLDDVSISITHKSSVSAPSTSNAANNDADFMMVSPLPVEENDTATPRDKYQRLTDPVTAPAAAVVLVDAVRGKTSSPQEEESQCVICLSSYEDGDAIRILPCLHRFHRDCVDKWLLGRGVCQCPVCRSDPRVLATQQEMPPPPQQQPRDALPLAAAVGHGADANRRRGGTPVDYWSDATTDASSD